MSGRSEPRRVWVTRAEPGASATARRLEALGFEPIVAPMIKTVALEASPPDRVAYDALAFTSSAAVARFAALSARRDETVFAVGDATADAALAQGWSHVVSADADLAGLAQVLTRRAKGLRILHPCASTPAGDLGELVGGASVIVLPVYATTPETQGPPRVLAAFQERDGAVLLHSPSAARAVAALPDMRGIAERLTAFALSEACAAPISALRLREIVVAPFPRETALLKVMSETPWP